MKNYKKINAWSVTETLKNIENSSDFITPAEIKNLKKALMIKHRLGELGFYIEHYRKEKKVDDNQADVNFVFKASKGHFTHGDIGNSFHEPVFKIWAWLLRTGEVKANEFI